MQQYAYHDGGSMFRRVSRTKAERAYKNGLRVQLCPCRLRPGPPYHPEMSISGKSGVPFQGQLDAFRYYGCTSDEAGRYPAFYIPARASDRSTCEEKAPGATGALEQYGYRFLGQATQGAAHGIDGEHAERR